MNFVCRVIITALVALGAHIGLIYILAGGNPPLSTMFVTELAVRWSIAALLANSMNWPFPLPLNALIIGGLTAFNMALIVLTFQGQLAFFQRALLTNGTGAVGLALGAALAAMVFTQRTKR
ncbi:MAG: hypothetical protein DHS20C05_25170 [Hyphococcus sp.]|nr:MAG: hypothetical protein DHS20C05_25170 [Marinicaulis sp.]